MQIDQITSSLNYEDGSTNIIINMQKILKLMGFNSNIYVEDSKPQLVFETLDCNLLKDNIDGIIYHFLPTSKSSCPIQDLNTKLKIMYCHAITPINNFSDYYRKILHARGKEKLKSLKNTIDLVITNSRSSKHELNDLGYQRIIVLPPPINLKDYAREPNPHLLEMYKDDYTNILFVGEISSNNRQLDILNVFNYYHKRINRKSRLFFIGNYLGHMSYYRKIIELMNELHIHNVFITGLVSFTQLLAYYRLSDVFLSMSEHTEYFTPLIEAIHFRVPVIAYHSSVAQEIMGEAGEWIVDKDVREVSRIIDQVVSDKKKRRELILRQSKKIVDYHPDRIISLYKEAIKNFF